MTSTPLQRTASLFTRSANGLQAWPDDRTTIGINAKSRVNVATNRMTGDGFIQIEEGEIAGPAGPVCLYIPRGGSVVIEAGEWIEDELERARR